MERDWVKPVQSASGSARSTIIFNVMEYGAVGDGRTLDTQALQAAIDACAARGGGTVWIPAGVYLTGSLFLRDHLTLVIDSGATLLGSQDPQDYPLIDSRWEGAYQPGYAPLIGGSGLRNIALVGRGTIDGQGAAWWQRLRERTLLYPRPRLVALADCQDVLIDGLTLTNSPSWTVNPVRCSDVNIQNLTIHNPPNSPNTDGINPDSCRDVHIANSHISVGDDCITIKAGTEREKPDKVAPCENITVTNCTMRAGHGGVVIGSEMSGGVRNVVISNCVFVGTDRGIRLKSRRGRGGVVEDVRINNIIMQDVACPFSMNLYYACGAWGDPLVADKTARPLDAGTPRFRRIHFSHITARDVRFAAAFLYGLGEAPLEDISFTDVSISLAQAAEAGFPDMADGLTAMQRAGFWISNVRGLRLQNVEVENQLGSALWVDNAAELEVAGFKNRTPSDSAPVIDLRNVEQGLIHGCQANRQTGVFIRLSGARTADMVLSGNHMFGARLPISMAVEVPPEEVMLM